MPKPLLLSVSCMPLHVLAMASGAAEDPEEKTMLRRAQEAAQPAEGGDEEYAFTYSGLPGILWVFIGLAIFVALLLLFGRRKIPDFSKETENLIVVPAASTAPPPDSAAPKLPMVDESETFHADETEPLTDLTKKEYDSTQPMDNSSNGPGLMRKATNPAGLVARPQYNPTGIMNGLIGGRRKRSSQAES